MGEKPIRMYFYIEVPSDGSVKHWIDKAFAEIGKSGLRSYGHDSISVDGQLIKVKWANSATELLDQSDYNAMKRRVTEKYAISVPLEADCAINEARSIIKVLSRLKKKMGSVNKNGAGK